MIDEETRTTWFWYEGLSIHLEDPLVAVLSVSFHHCLANRLPIPASLHSCRQHPDWVGDQDVDAACCGCDQKRCPQTQTPRRYRFRKRLTRVMSSELWYTRAFSHVQACDINFHTCEFHKQLIKGCDMEQGLGKQVSLPRIVRRVGRSFGPTHENSFSQSGIEIEIHSLRKSNTEQRGAKAIVEPQKAPLFHYLQHKAQVQHAVRLKSSAGLILSERNTPDCQEHCSFRFTR